MKPTPPHNPNTRADRLADAVPSPFARPRHKLRLPTVSARGLDDAHRRREGAVRPERSLRLVGADETNEQHVASAATATPPEPTPITGATDPRWVLAVRTAEALQGDILPPEQRERLIALAKMMGLTPFDGCLIIAMVQDQARRGLIARQCPAAISPQLSMIPLPQPRKLFAGLRDKPGQVVLLTTGLLTLQALIAWIILR